MQNSKVSKGVGISIAVLIIICVLGACFVYGLAQVNVNSIISDYQEISNYVITEDGVWIDYLGDRKELVVPETYSLTEKKFKREIFSGSQYYLENLAERYGETEYTIEDVSEKYPNQYNKQYKLTLYMRKVISGTDYTTREVGEQIYRNRSGPTKVVLPNTITTINYGAFCGCSSLKSINIPDSVTKFENAIFFACYSLEEIVLPNTITSSSIQTFQHCSSLKSINIPTSLSYLNYGDLGSTAITEITIPSNIYSLAEGVFMYCADLKTVIFEEDEGKGAKYLGMRLFTNCTSLENIELPSTVISISDRAFEGCSSLNTITVKSTTIPRLGTDVIPANVEKIYVADELYEQYLSNDEWSQYADRIFRISEKA